MPIISLKQDKGTYTSILWIGKVCRRVKKYNTNEPIDCYHRLYLSPNDLRLLYRIGKVSKKIEHEESDEKIKELIEEKGKLIEQLYKTLNNPYKLDIEEYDNGNIGFYFYDYDYDYHIIRTRDGWYTYCNHSDTWSDGEACEIDEPSDKPSPVFTGKIKMQPIN